MTTIERHPPERRENRGVIVACTGSCCCCCCCLHTLGGIVGAAVASPSGTSTDGASQASSAKAAHTYWLLLVALCGLIAAGGMSIAYSDRGRWQDVAIVVGGLVLGLPLVQIAVSVAAVILIAINWPFRFADKRAALKRIGRITRHTITGTMVGVIIMFIMWYLMIGLN